MKNLAFLLNKKSASIAVIRGRRRIGKSRLIAEFAKNERFYRFSGIPPVEGTTAQSQKDIFAQQLGEQIGVSGLKGLDWADLFTLLAKETRQGRVIISLDEISWMGTKDPTFLGKLKNAWDLQLKQNPQLILFLCGSVSAWIEENILSSTGFLGRISMPMLLEELPLSDCNKLLEVIGFQAPAHEKFKIVSVTGGVPWYLEHVDPSLNADDNIQRLCFRKNGILIHEFENIFHDLFGRRGQIYTKIVEFLVSGPKEFDEIHKGLGYAKSGALLQYLNELKEAGFIRRDYTWVLKNSRSSKLSHFRLSDNYLRFYLKYIHPEKERILEGAFEDVMLTSLPKWKTIMGLQFENLVLSNRPDILQALNLNPNDVVANNPFFQRKTLRQRGCQIDYMIQTKFETLFVCEIKFSRNEIGSKVINEVREKISRISLPKNMLCRPVLIHANGVSKGVEQSGYFAKIIDFRDLLK